MSKDQAELKSFLSLSQTGKNFLGGYLGFESHRCYLLLILLESGEEKALCFWF